MAKKKQKEEEKSEEQKQAFLAKMAKQFLNEADGYDFSAADMAELAIRLAYVMVRFSYIVDMPKDMSEERKKDASENATLFYMAYYGRSNEKALREKGTSYGEVKKEIEKLQKKAKNKKEE